MTRREILDKVAKVFLPIVLGGAAVKPIGAHEMEDILLTIHITVYRDLSVEVDTEHGPPEE